MNSLKLSPKKVKGIFITHEHSDHVKGVDVFARTFNIPIYATNGTIKNGFLCSNNELVNQIKNDETISLGGLQIKAFSKSHKAADPVSYAISDKKKVVSVITDAGYACENIHDAISKSDFLFLESNHDIPMLEVGPYPYFLKEWVKGNTGHLSNNQAGLAVLEHGKRKLQHVVLSHLSETNNTPAVALKTFRGLIKERIDFKTNVSVSLGNLPTQVFGV
jgi:phosphoribosyl 1,2-cyclic phosphodiesterase